MTEPPHNPDAERSVLGTVLLSPACLDALLVDRGLRPAHFYLPRHQLLFATMTDLRDANKAVDALTVCEHLKAAGEIHNAGGEPYVQSLSAQVESVSNVGRYAEIVVEHATMRRVRDGAQTILRGVEARDPELIDQGERLLVRHDDLERRTSHPSQLADEIFQALDRTDPVETFHWPFPRLDKLTLGGMRRGQLALIAGWQKMGKSIWLDQCLSAFSQAGLRTHLFINEMTKRERTERTVARMSGVAYEKVTMNVLDRLERKRILDVLTQIPFGITDCSGWSGQEVAREVKRNRYDVVGIDILNRFPGVTERKVIEELSRTLNELAKPSQGNCAILLAAHLNRNRVGQGVTLPFPAVGDLRETGMLANDADYTLFVHRDQDEDTGDALSTGLVRVALARTGRPGAVPVRLNTDRMEFEPTMREATVAA